MSDESRLVSGLSGDDAGQPEQVVKKMPEGMKGEIGGNIKTSGFFDQLARGETKQDENKSEAEPAEEKPVSAPKSSEPAPISEEKAVIPESLPKKEGIVGGGQPGRAQGRCENCGLNLGLLKPDEPTDKDKRDFVAYALGADDFTRDYVYMGGALTITMRTRKAKESDSIMRIMRRLVADKLVPEMPITMNESYAYNMQRLLAATSVSSISFKDKETKRYDRSWLNLDDEEMDGAIVGRHKELTNELSESVMSLLLHTQRTFDTLVDLLVRRAADPDFYSPTDG